MNYTYGQRVEARYADGVKNPLVSRQYTAYGWHTGYRFIAYDLDNKTCLLERSTGLYAGIPIRFDLEDVRNFQERPEPSLSSRLLGRLLPFRSKSR